MSSHYLQPAPGTGTVLEVNPESAGWSSLHFSVQKLDEGDKHTIETGDLEMAVVPLGGTFSASIDGEEYRLSRGGVFEEMPSVLYTPPGKTIEIEASSGVEYAFGGAEAEGRYPTRLFEPGEMKTELRGGGAATRQVNHVLAHPLPAERLILYEVYVPRGAWSGWPPHCHDGYEGSPYLEEVYYFRLDPEDGWALHRNYRVDTDFDEVFSVADRGLVLVTQGFHSSAAAPGSNMYFLNYLAGELRDDERAIPPFFQPEYRWIDGNWEEGLMTLPAVRP